VACATAEASRASALQLIYDFVWLSCRGLSSSNTRRPSARRRLKPSGPPSCPPPHDDDVAGQANSAHTMNTVAAIDSRDIAFVDPEVAGSVEGLARAVAGLVPSHALPHGPIVPLCDGTTNRRTCCPAPALVATV
jgi:hypothetical protein